jgi:BMFP domain-containing protein YqiC
MASLDDVLSEEKPVETVVEAPVVETADPVERTISKREEHREKEYAAQGRDPETGKFVPKEEPKEEVKAEPKVEPKVEAKVDPKPVPQFTDKEKALLRAAQAERDKRQELERRLAALEANKPQEPEKTFWDDPEGKLKKQQDELQALREEIRQMMVGTKMQTAESLARYKYQDFDEKIQIFTELAQTTPGLGQQLLSAPDPAEFAYRTATAHKQLTEAGSIENLRASIEKEVRAKIEGELKAKEEELRKQRANLPPSLSDARGARVNKPVWNGPTPLDTVLKI